MASPHRPHTGFFKLSLSGACQEDVAASTSVCHAGLSHAGLSQTANTQSLRQPKVITIEINVSFVVDRQNKMNIKTKF